MINTHDPLWYISNRSVTVCYYSSTGEDQAGYAEAKTGDDTNGHPDWCGTACIATSQA